MVATTEAEPPAKKKTKTFTGCFTCRKRKIRCDLLRPACDNCWRAGVPCSGYIINLRWLLPVQFRPNGHNPVQQPVSFEGPRADDCDPAGREFFQRRNVGFVVWDEKKNCRPYETYEEMDDDLNVLRDGEVSWTTTLRGPFGVFGVRKTTKSGAGIVPGTLTQKAAQQTHHKTLPRQLSTCIAQESPASTNLPSGILHSSPALPHPSPRLTSDLENVAKDQLWLSNELRDHALLTAAALNGDPQFLDFDLLSLENQSVPESQSNLLNLVFHRHSHQNVSTEPAEPSAYPISFSQPLSPDNAKAGQENVVINPDNQHLFYSNYANFYYDNPYLPNETLDIQLHASSCIQYNDAEMHEKEPLQQTNMPEAIMSIVRRPLQPDLGFDVSLPNNGVLLPTTALQVQPLTRYLLNYYLTQVADLMTVIPLTESPWKTIYFPRALLAIGELLALGKTSVAKNALLNALLAVSAFNLQSKFAKNSPQMRFYLNLGIRLRNQASTFVKALLGSGSNIAESVAWCVASEKYKDILCAIMSMISVDLVWGTMQDTNYYIMCCQRVIQTKMRAKKKLSSKVKILHRIFLSMKLIQDSTCMDLANIKENMEISRSTSQHNWCVDTWLLSSVKTRIHHLVDKSRVSTPMFVNKKLINANKNDENFATDALYGIPNSLIVLFSDTVHLLRRKIYLHDTNGDFPANFSEEAADLGRRIDSWELDWKLFDGTPESRNFLSAMHEATYHHIMSFYQTLLVYYSRFIRDIAPEKLQDKVAATLDHLNSIQNLIAKDEAHIIPLFWQGFIAGCEATSTHLQMRFKKWGADIAQYLGSYWGARQIMLEVWRRKSIKDPKADWVSVIQDWEMNLMLN